MIPVVKSLSVEGAVGPSADKFLVRKPSQEEAEAAVRTLLLWAGDDPSREGLAETPRRVAKAYREMFSGYDQCPADDEGTSVVSIAGVVWS